MDRSGYLPRPLALRSGVLVVWCLACMIAWADAVTTYLAIDSGAAREGNPVVAHLIAAVGLFPALVLRATLFGPGVMLVVAVFASADRRLLRTGSAALLGAGTLFWAIVLGNNLALLLR